MLRPATPGIQPHANYRYETAVTTVVLILVGAALYSVSEARSETWFSCYAAQYILRVCQP